MSDDGRTGGWVDGWMGVGGHGLLAERPRSSAAGHVTRFRTPPQMLRQERCAPVLTRTSVQRASGVRVTEKRRGLRDLLKPSRAPTQVPSRLSPCRPCVGLAPGSRAGGRAGTPGLRGPGEGDGWGRPRAAPGFGFPLSTTGHLWPHIQRLRAAGGLGEMSLSLPPGRLQPVTQPPPPPSGCRHHFSMLWCIRRPFCQPLLPSPYSRPQTHRELGS